MTAVTALTDEGAAPEEQWAGRPTRPAEMNRLEQSPVATTHDPPYLRSYFKSGP